MTETLNDGFDQPHEVSDILLAFPGDVSSLMPAYEDIPAEFRAWPGTTDWHSFIQHWMYSGNPCEVWNLYTKDGVDDAAAMRHLTAVMKSFQPKHEHKEAAAVWLLSRWFSKIDKKA